MTIDTDIKFSTFPRTEPPSKIAIETVGVFKNHIENISTIKLDNGLKSDEVLSTLEVDLIKLGFEVETGKSKSQKIHRPVFYGENGQITVKYEIDGFHPIYKTGLEIEAGRAWKGNAIYRDLIINLLLIDVEHLIIAVPLNYKYRSNGKLMKNRDYELSRNLIDNLYSQTRFRMPYKLTLIGY